MTLRTFYANYFLAFNLIDFDSLSDEKQLYYILRIK